MKFSIKTSLQLLAVTGAMCLSNAQAATPSLTPYQDAGVRFSGKVDVLFRVMSFDYDTIRRLVRTSLPGELQTLINSTNKPNFSTFTACKDTTAAANNVMNMADEFNMTFRNTILNAIASGMPLEGYGNWITNKDTNSYCEYDAKALYEAVTAPGYAADTFYNRNQKTANGVSQGRMVEIGLDIIGFALLPVTLYTTINAVANWMNSLTQAEIQNLTLSQIATIYCFCFSKGNNRFANTAFITTIDGYSLGNYVIEEGAWPHIYNNLTAVQKGDSTSGLFGWLTKVKHYLNRTDASSRFRSPPQLELKNILTQ